MKRIFTLLVVGVFAFSLVACDNQATTGAVGDAVGAATDQVADSATGGIDMGDAALGAVGGMMLGSMLGGNSSRSNNYTTIVKQKNVYKVSPSRPSSPARSSFSRSSSFSRGGRR